MRMNDDAPNHQDAQQPRASLDTLLPRPIREARGRKLTRRLAEAYCDAIRRGLTRDAAAAAIGVHRATIWTWLVKGEQGRPAYRWFAEMVAQAFGEFEAIHTANISEAARADWRASAWLLERRIPQRFGRRASVEFVEPGRVQATREDELAAARERRGLLVAGVVEDAEIVEEAADE